MTNIAVRPTQTTAFYVQSAISFAVSTASVMLGIAYLPASGWMRSFLAVGLLYCITSSFTLAKCVRDHQEASSVVHRVDEARLEKFITEYDPLKSAI